MLYLTPPGRNATDERRLPNSYEYGAPSARNVKPKPLNFLNGAGVAKRAREQRTVCVQLHFEIVCRDFAQAPPVLEVPTLGRTQQTHVALAELTGTRATVGGRVKPHGEIAGIEGERRCCHGVATGPRTLPPHGETVHRNCG